MRILGKECHALTAIDISHARSISDVGISNLSKGCPNLKKLKCHSAFLLSDPRFFPEDSANHIPISSSQRKAALQEKEEDFDIINMSTTLLKSESTSALLATSTIASSAMPLIRSSSFFDNTKKLEGDSTMGGANLAGGSTSLLENSAFSLPSVKTPSSFQSKTNLPRKLEIWEESIGIVALVGNCPNLDSLDLSGCFRLNRVLGKSISKCQYLINLNLKGCNQVSASSLMALFPSIPLLEDLNLSDCGKGITNDVLINLSVYCKSLKFLYLARCIEISGKGIKGIANIKMLEKLDLSGCKYLNDSRMVYLVSSDKVKKLQTLDISQIPKLSDSFLAWISMKDHCLLHLSCKGTSITSKALTSVKDRFPYCDLLINDNYYGFWSKYRVFDRLLINSYATMMNGFILLQSRCRKMIAIRRVSRLVEDRRILAAYLTMHRIARGFLARCRITKLKKQYSLLNYSSMIISSFFHGIKARKRVKRLRKNRYLRSLHEKSILIQCFYRCYLAKKNLYQKKEKKLQLKLLKIRCTILLQSICRMYLGKCYYYKKKEMKRKSLIFIHSKSSMIQRLYRGFHARQLVNRMKSLVYAIQQKRLIAICCLQRSFRAYRTRHVIHNRLVIKNERRNAIITIQSLCRGFITRLHYSELIYEIDLKRKIKAVLKIQCIYRVYIAKKLFFEKIRFLHYQKKLFYDSAKKIQNQIKMKLARITLRKKRQEYYNRLKYQTQQTINCCILIQSIIRRYQCQKKYYKKLNEIKNKWKELYDETKQKRFFYNKLTGEIRWKIPQDLLDLIPNPHCDNCCQIDAMIECKQCSELFCSECFSTIHANGRRKQHEFRSLFDYYGKRIDYGDGEEQDDPNYQKKNRVGAGGGNVPTIQGGKVYYISSDSESDDDDDDEAGEHERDDEGLMEKKKKKSKNKKEKQKREKLKQQNLYPCQWPTEIIQDEVQGWMLRIAPYRKPLKLYGLSGWEEYHFTDQDYSSLQKSIQNMKTSEEQRRIQKLIIKSSPKIFYFNRKTFETSYHIPKEIEHLIPKVKTVDENESEYVHHDTSSRPVSSIFSRPATYDDGTGYVDPSAQYPYPQQQQYEQQQPYQQHPYQQQPAMGNSSYMYQTANGTFRPVMPGETPQSPPVMMDSTMMQSRGGTTYSRNGATHQYYYYPAYYYNQQQPQPQVPLTAFSQSSSGNDIGSSPSTAAGGHNPSASWDYSEVRPYTDSGIEPSSAFPSFYGGYSASASNNNIQTPYTPYSQHPYSWSSQPGTAGDYDPNAALGYYDEHGQWVWYDYPSADQGQQQQQQQQQQQDYYYHPSSAHTPGKSGAATNPSSIPESRPKSQQSRTTIQKASDNMASFQHSSQPVEEDEGEDEEENEDSEEDEDSEDDEETAGSYESSNDS
jgi:hypothetical protein